MGYYTEKAEKEIRAKYGIPKDIPVQLTLNRRACNFRRFNIANHKKLKTLLYEVPETWQVRFSGN